MSDVGPQAQEAFCIVERGGVRLALPVGDVCRVLGRRRVTPIPRAPTHVVGLIDDGEHPVLALRIDPWLTAAPRSLAAAALVVLRGCDPLLGVAVDRLCGVALLPDVVEATPAQAAAIGIAAALVAAYRRGADGIVPVLAVGALVDAIGSQWGGEVPGGGRDGR